VLLDSRHTLLIRFSALGVLTFCLILFSRESENSLGLSAASATQTQDSVITVEVQDNAPLTISSVASTSPNYADPEILEFGYYIINTSPKPIRAYAIKQGLSVDGTRGGVTVSLYNLQVANSVLRPNESSFIGDSASLTPGKKNIVILSVDFVEFSDGSKWGSDSIKSSVQAAGQRAGAKSVSERLLQILNKGKIEDVIREIEEASTTVEVPPNESEEWRIGFRQGRVSVLNRLRRAKVKNGTRELDRELRRFGETFKSVE
jgi:hypothetical protein